MNRRWTVRDRYGNLIYLTQERWDHIIDPINHPHVADYEEYLKIAISEGKRRQEALHPDKYRYIHFFDDLSEDVNCIEVVVNFRFDDRNIPNNWVVTAYFKQIMQKRGEP